MLRIVAYLYDKFLSIAIANMVKHEKQRGQDKLPKFWNWHPLTEFSAGEKRKAKPYLPAQDYRTGELHHYSCFLC